MSNSLDDLEAMGITSADVDARDTRQKRGGPIDRRICMCGHPINRHKIHMTPENPKGVPWTEGPVPSTGMLCRINAMNCSCKEPIPVLKVTDARSFLRTTEGAGAAHALIRGIRDIMPKATYEWLIDIKCQRCGVIGAEHKIQPVPLTKLQKKTLDGKSQGYDRFLCLNCREDVR
jgi:hypothetical protein